MDLRHIMDGTQLPGARVEIRRQGGYVCSGLADAVTDDGKILWVRSPEHERRLFEKMSPMKPGQLKTAPASTTRSRLV